MSLSYGICRTSDDCILGHTIDDLIVVRIDDANLDTLDILASSLSENE